MFWICDALVGLAGGAGTAQWFPATADPVRDRPRVAAATASATTVRRELRVIAWAMRTRVNNETSEKGVDEPRGSYPGGHADNRTPRERSTKPPGPASPAGSRPTRRSREPGTRG